MQNLTFSGEIVGTIFDADLEKDQLVKIFKFILGDSYTITEKEKEVLLTKEQNKVILHYLLKNEYINAIKMYRLYTGCYLKDAKQYIDDIRG